MSDPVSVAASLFTIFPYMKMLLKGNRFQDMEDIEQNTMMQLLVIPKTLSQKCFAQWKDCWNRCVVSKGDYFEGD
jgi:hypothetical protein